MARRVATYNKKNKKQKKGTIPTFGYKSAIIIVLVAALSTFFLPNMVAMLGGDSKITTLLASALFISLAVAYCQCYIESNEGFGNRFIRLFICFFITIAIICYFWIYIGLYM